MTCQGFSDGLCGGFVVWVVLLPLLLLQDLWAAASGLLVSAGMRWSAVNGSSGRLPSPHIQQAMALFLICLARLA